MLFVSSVNFQNIKVEVLCKFHAELSNVMLFTVMSCYKLSHNVKYDLKKRTAHNMLSCDVKLAVHYKQAPAHLFTHLFKPLLCTLQLL